MRSSDINRDTVAIQLIVVPSLFGFGIFIIFRTSPNNGQYIQDSCSPLNPPSKEPVVMSWGDSNLCASVLSLCLAVVYRCVMPFFLLACDLQIISSSLAMEGSCHFRYILIQ